MLRHALYPLVAALLLLAGDAPGVGLLGAVFVGAWCVGLRNGKSNGTEVTT